MRKIKVSILTVLLSTVMIGSYAQGIKVIKAPEVKTYATYLKVEVKNLNNFIYEEDTGLFYYTNKSFNLNKTLIDLSLTTNEIKSYYDLWNIVSASQGNAYNQALAKDLTDTFLFKGPVLIYDKKKKTMKLYYYHAEPILPDEYRE